MKKFLVLIVLAVFAITLTACWPAEVGVTTVFNANGSGTRTIVVDIMDDTLSSTAIGNPDDPAGTEGKGAVLNDKHITGGVIAIQKWLKDNAPDFITVEDAKVDGYHRYFTMTYEFKNFDDFLDKYEKLVNLSPNLNWSDFDANEKPTLVIEGSFKKTLTFKESRAMLEASLDWAVDGIWKDIYDEADLAGYVTKADISTLAGYKVEMGDKNIEKLRAYNPDATDGDFTGKVIFVEDESFTLSGEFTNTGLIVGLIIAGVAVIGGAVFLVIKFK